MAVSAEALLAHVYQCTPCAANIRNVAELQCRAMFQAIRANRCLSTSARSLQDDLGTPSGTHLQQFSHLSRAIFLPSIPDNNAVFCLLPALRAFTPTGISACLFDVLDGHAPQLASSLISSRASCSGAQSVSRVRPTCWLLPELQGMLLVRAQDRTRAMASSISFLRTSAITSSSFTFSNSSIFRCPTVASRSSFHVPKHIAQCCTLGRF